MKKRVLAVAAHPDDIEFLMAGTLLQLKQAGFELHYMTVANGCCGSLHEDRQTTAAVRRHESMAAAECLGAVYHESITNDLEVFYSRELLAKLSAVVREVSPSIVLTHALADYMEDHMNVARLAVTASFTRAMPNFPVDPPTPVYPGQVAVYHAQPFSHHDPLGNLFRPKIAINVTSFRDKKRELLACHRSQKEWLDTTQELDSYLDHMTELDRLAGSWTEKFEMAEGWSKHLHVGLAAADFDPLVDGLPPSEIEWLDCA